MKIPSRVRVAGHTYTIKLMDDIWGMDTEQHGDCDVEKMLIRLDKTRPIAILRETLHHEITHVIYHEYGIQQGDDEERVVTMTSRGWCQVLADNSVVRRFFA